ncbi:hypothetical protein [Pelagicoccus sp. SDUM812002]|nr:hypothetical protein [Pelagicoccus sp. SDUM812002]MDQ8188500.1 hypothetical protein [Pelagicoccus sp. SDUM812002]
MYGSNPRRIGYLNSGAGKTLSLLTNHFGLEAIEAARVHMARWKNELTF